MNALTAICDDPNEHDEEESKLFKKFNVKNNRKKYINKVSMKKIRINKSKDYPKNTSLESYNEIINLEDLEEISLKK